MLQLSPRKVGDGFVRSQYHFAGTEVGQDDSSSLFTSAVGLRISVISAAIRGCVLLLLNFLTYVIVVSAGFIGDAHAVPLRVSLAVRGHGSSKRVALFVALCMLAITHWPPGDSMVAEIGHHEYFRSKEEAVEW